MAYVSRGPIAPIERVVLGAAGLAMFFGLWLLVSQAGFGLVSTQFLPSPSEVFWMFRRLLSESFAGATLPEHLSASVHRFLLGYGIAVAIGIPLGLLMGWLRWLDYIVTPLFEAVRYVAPIAWVPFAALWFGTGIGGSVLIIFMGAFAPVLVNAYRGSRFVDVTLIEAAQTLGVGPLRMLLEVLLPAALPSIVAGLRISAGIGWQSLIGAELIVVSNGIGYMMVQGQSIVSTSIVMAGMVAIGLVGVLIDLMLRVLEATMRRRWGRGAA